MSQIKRCLLLILALISLGVGILGIFIPGLPTTEFVLLAVWAAARSSPRLHQWILHHRVLGPFVLHWQHGKLPRRVKWLMTLTMSLAAVFIMYKIHHTLSVIILLTMMACVLVWAWKRPEPDNPHTK